MNIVTQQDKEKIEILNTKDDMIRKRDEVHFLRIEVPHHANFFYLT